MNFNMVCGNSPLGSMALISLRKAVGIPIVASTFRRQYEGSQNKVIDLLKLFRVSAQDARKLCSKSLDRHPIRDRA